MKSHSGGFMEGSIAPSSLKLKGIQRLHVLPVFSPVLNCISTGTVNFTVNMYPTGNITIGNTANVEEEIDFHELFVGINVTKDLI